MSARAPFVDDQAVISPPEDATAGIHSAAPFVRAGESGYRVTWSEGEPRPARDTIGAGEALVLAYRSPELASLDPDERALAATRRSYGTPVFVSATQEQARDDQPIVSVRLGSTSGDRFPPMSIASPHGFASHRELLAWLPRADLAIVLGTPRAGTGLAGDRRADFEPRVVLDGASFTDGERTVTAQAGREGGISGDLGSLTSRSAEIARGNIGSRTRWLTRPRSTKRDDDWTFTSESGPVPVAFTLSGHGRTRSDADAAYVLTGTDDDHRLYVETGEECKSGTYLRYRIGDKEDSVEATCEAVERLGLVYRTRYIAPYLSAAMLAGASMRVSVLDGHGADGREHHDFSLMGFTAASHRLETDYRSLARRARALFADRGPSEAATAMLAKRLRTPPEPAAATPAPRATSSNDFVVRYARGLAAQLEQASHPACAAIATHMRESAASDLAEALRKRQVDALLDRTPARCL